MTVGESGTKVAVLNAYCITLPEKPERQKRAEEEFKKANIFAHFIPGIHGEVSGLKTVFPYEDDNPGSGFNIGHHCVGIWLSHLIVWNIVAASGNDYALVFEDDAILDEHFLFKVASNKAEAPPDWDFIFLGSCCAAGKGGTHIGGNLWEIKHPMCLHAYLISRKCAQRLILEQRKVYAPIDISLPKHSFPGMKVYTVQPSIAQQHNTVIPA